MVNSIKISSIFNFSDWDSSVIIHLFRKLSKKKIIISKPADADILFIGPYNINSFKEKILRYVKKNFYFNYENIFPNIDIDSFKRLYNPIRIFLSFENYRYDHIKSDYFITGDMGVSNINHLRFPYFKDCIDWSVTEDIFREKNTLNAHRFGFYWKIEDLMNPQGDEFLKKKKEFSFISSHLNEPRKSIHETLSKKFKINSFGRQFDKNIKNHNSSNFKTYDILSKYAFNLCPENSLYPGYYTEKLGNAFLSKTLPVTWADKNINYDFNEKAFINLIDYSKDNYQNLFELLEDEDFLKSFTSQPLLIKKPNLDEEKKFILKIISNF